MCTGEDNAGNDDTVVAQYTLVIPPPSSTTIDTSDFDNFEGWTTCQGSRSASLTTLDGRTVTYLKGRKRFNTCIQKTVPIVQSASSYELTCNARKSGAYAELAISFEGQEWIPMEIGTSNNFVTTAPVVLDDDGSSSDIRIRLSTQAGSNSNLYVDSCSLVAKN